MDSVDRNLILTPAADKIRDYCYELGVSPQNSRLEVHALPGCHNEGKWA
jgi:hypothetical protein